MSEKENMRIWLEIDKTDPKYTKKLTFGAGFKPTVVDAQYQIKQATRVMGPIGIGWGIRNQKIEHLRIDPSNYQKDKLLYTANLWVRDKDGSVGDGFDFSSDINLYESTKNGIKEVSDPVKKVSTDALTKALSRLGMSADIFMGRFDDNAYLQERTQEADKERAVEETKEKELRAKLEAEKNAGEINKFVASINQCLTNLHGYGADQEDTERVTKAFAPAGLENATLDKLKMLETFMTKMEWVFSIHKNMKNVKGKEKKAEAAKAINTLLGLDELPLVFSSTNAATKLTVDQLKALSNAIDNLI